MKKTVGELLKGKNIEENLNKYVTGYNDIAFRYSILRLALNYYTFYMMTSEESELLNADSLEMIGELNLLIKNGFVDDEIDKTRAIEQLKDMRQSVIQKVADVTCFVDRLNLYEHGLNRVEYRFRQEDVELKYSDEAFTKRLMKFILSDEDNVVINSKIAQVVGQLPIRFTKAKFFDMVSAGLSIYKGGTKSGLNDFLYMIRTSSMLDKSQTMDTNYPELAEVIDRLREIDFKNIDKSQYEEQMDNIKRSSQYIEDVMSQIMMIQQIINDLLVVFYSMEYREDNNEADICSQIVSETNLLFMGKFSHLSSSELEELFVGLEGIQEELYPLLTAYNIVEQIKENCADQIEEAGLKEKVQQISDIVKLSGDSIFIELDRETDESEVDEAYLSQVETKLFDDYTEVFKNNQKVINRAIMNSAISELPVFFNNISELQDFIYDTLSLCNDKAEKLACIEILESIIKEG